MRVTLLLLAAGAFTSCSAVPQPVIGRAPDKQTELAQFVAGKFARAPISCLSHYRAYDMRPIDENTVAFRDGTSRTYVMHMTAGCSNLGSTHEALLTHEVGSPNMCSGDIVRVVDTLSWTTVGSCGIGEITPFVSP